MTYMDFSNTFFFDFESTTEVKLQSTKKSQAPVNKKVNEKSISQDPVNEKSMKSQLVTNGDDNVAAQPVPGSHLVTPVEDPGCQSPRWGAQIQVRMVTSSFEVTIRANLPSSQDDAFQVRPHYIICQGSIYMGSQGQGQPFHNGRRHGCQLSSAKASSRRAAKAKDSRSATDDDVAAQSQPKSHLVTPAEDPGHKSPDQAGMAPSLSEHSDDGDKSHSHLQVLLRDKLRQWVDEHKIESQGKRLTRIDLIKVITGAAKLEQPTKEDIKSIVNERKSKRNTKAAY
ncbi:hypothetical protein EDB85DRAFT_1887628 [Lactarius pseudohatsudake]|nr:hypothetical protein EDB85DRAFT_1887628 [Lactarius pseudohatsudake]